jgi:hypothetical protein
MKLFDLHSAREVLPEVRRLMGQAMEARARWMEIRQEVAGFASRAEALGGGWLAAERSGRWQTEMTRAAASIQEALAALESLGVQVKDLDLGLVDFPTLYRGRQVLLCWRVGEPDIAWWHGLEEGFAGRRRIDEEFLAHHRGD